MNKTLTVLFLFCLTSTGYSQVKMQRIEGGLLFTENDTRILIYQIDAKNLDGTYERNNYIHPLWGPGEDILTEDFPVDHLHHRGVFWAWHQIWIGDQRIGDGWELKNFKQEVGEVEYARKKDGSAVLKTEVYWKSDQWKVEGIEEPYLKENTSIIIYPLNGDFRKIDFEISLLALVENLKIGGSEDEKGYSGFSVRMILPDDVSFNGPNGKVKPQNEAVQSPGYVKISGSLLNNNKKGGIVIVDHPENPGYPQPWILRAKNSMQNAAFPGNMTMPISTQVPLILRYSLLVYSGNLNNKKIQKIINNH